MKNQTTILIIDDEPAVVELIKMKLNIEGFEVIESRSGEEGLMKAREESPDLILLDILMPGMSGIEVLKKLRNDKGALLAPVIILSNSGREEEIGQGKKLGASDYVIKAQLSLEDLVEKINKVRKNG